MIMMDDTVDVHVDNDDDDAAIDDDEDYNDDDEVFLSHTSLTLFFLIPLPFD